jgi:hypothetical protein
MRVAGRAAIAGLALLAAGCGVRDRQALVGRYVVDGTGETWTLQDDGRCRIERNGATEACEWVFRQGEDGIRLVVTVGAGGGPAAHSRRYVLAPGKWPGQPVTIPLSASRTLRKQPS